MSLWKKNVEKTLPIQSSIKEEEGTEVKGKLSMSTRYAYRSFEVANRGVNLVVDGASQINIDVMETIDSVVPIVDRRPQKKRLNAILNHAPNPYDSIDRLWTACWMDFMLYGAFYLFYDDGELYHIPARNLTTVVGSRDRVKQYRYEGSFTHIFQADEIIPVVDNNTDSAYKGYPRLQSALTSVGIMAEMNEFQHNFFKNGTVFGLIIESDTTLSEKIKERIVKKWRRDYNASMHGGSKPLILDGGMKAKSLSEKNAYSGLDFSGGFTDREEKLLYALGVPSVLLNSGNNANIMPNLKLFYLTTVLPLHRKLLKALEVYFGYKLQPILEDIQALQPELRELANFLTTLKNSGIITANEARKKLRMEASDDESADDLILPANIAGSAANPSTGGKPPNEDEE